jgi:hypothetical protein
VQSIRHRPAVRWLATLLLAAVTLIATRQAESPYAQTVIAIVGLTAMFAAFPPPLQRAIRYMEAYCHEVCHGLAGLAVGGLWHRFRVDSAGSGVALVATPAGPRSLLVIAAGYLGVITIGAFTLAAAAFPRLRMTALIALILLFAFPLPRAGSLLTAIIGVIMTGLLLAAAYSLRPPHRADLLALVLRALAALLIASGFDSLRQLMALTWRSPRGVSDAHRVAHATGLPAWLVAAFAMLVGIAIVALSLLGVFHAA